VTSKFPQLAVTRGAQSDAFSIESPSKTVANVKHGPQAEQIANLFAASPDMLDALKALVASILSWEASVREVIHIEPKHGMDLTAAEAAIKKAEGQ
jgi:hypothetical protein